MMLDADQRGIFLRAKLVTVDETSCYNLPSICCRRVRTLMTMPESDIDAFISELERLGLN
jgi:hypothetical protein